jgi:hypothetical protein
LSRTRRLARSDSLSTGGKAGQGTNQREPSIRRHLEASGQKPVSVAVNRFYVYVVNAGGTPNISGFLIDTIGGHLVPLRNSQPLALSCICRDNDLLHRSMRATALRLAGCFRLTSATAFPAAERIDAFNN